jgi:Rrf2 family transcriptional regulator, iron-sulfur cluster assembly transcription factor
MLLRRDRAMTGIAIMLDVAFYAGSGTAATAGEIAERLSQARRGIEPILQALARAGLLESLRGPKGGYRLGRPKRELRLSEIVAAAAAEGKSLPLTAMGGRQSGVLDQYWKELEELCQAQLERCNLDDMMKRASQAGWERPSGQSIDFVI